MSKIYGAELSLSSHSLELEQQKMRVSRLNDVAGNLNKKITGAPQNRYQKGLHDKKESENSSGIEDLESRDVSEDQGQNACDTTSRPLTVMERVLAAKSQKKYFDETLSQGSSVGDEHSCAFQSERKDDFTRSISVVRDDDVDSAYTSAMGQSYDYDSENDDNTVVTPGVVLAALRDLMRFDTIPEDGSISFDFQDDDSSSEISASDSFWNKEKDDAHDDSQAARSQRSIHSQNSHISIVPSEVLTHHAQYHGGKNYKKNGRSLSKLFSQRTMLDDEASSAGVEFSIDQFKEIKREELSEYRIGERANNDTANKLKLPSFSKRVGCDEASCAGIEMSLSELTKLKVDEKVTSRSSRSQLSRSDRIVQRQWRRTPDSEISSEGIEYPISQFPKLGQQKLATIPDQNELGSQRPRALPSKTIDNMGSNVAMPCSTPSCSTHADEPTNGSLHHQNHSASLMDIFTWWIPVSPTCVCCKESFNLIDGRSECVIGDPRAHITGMIHVFCKEEYDQICQKYNQVVRQMALFGILKNKYETKKETREHNNHEKRGSRGGKFWSHFQRDVRRSRKPKQMILASSKNEARARSRRHGQRQVGDSRPRPAISTRRRTGGSRKQRRLASPQMLPIPERRALPSPSIPATEMEKDSVIVCPRGSIRHPAQHKSRS